MSNEEIAKELLSVLMEKMWFREGLPSEGWAVEKICNALEAAQQSVQPTLLDDGQIFKMPEPKVIARGHIVLDDPQSV